MRVCPLCLITRRILSGRQGVHSSESILSLLCRLQATKLIFFERMEKYKKTENNLSFKILDSQFSHWTYVELKTQVGGQHCRTGGEATTCGSIPHQSTSLSSDCSASDSAPCCCTWEGHGGWPTFFGHWHPWGRPSWNPGSWVWSDSAALAVILEMNQEMMEDLFVCIPPPTPAMSFCPSNKPINL